MPYTVKEKLQQLRDTEPGAACPPFMDTFNYVRDLQELAKEALIEMHEGWKEATIAWAVCASLHREYCKGKDPFFRTRQADFIKHEEEARAKFLGNSIDPST